MTLTAYLPHSLCVCDFVFSYVVVFSTFSIAWEKISHRVLKWHQASMILIYCVALFGRQRV